MNPIRSLRLLPRSSGPIKNNWTCSQCRHYATPPPTTLPAPPLLLKIRKDLKNAMKDKDTNRLNVLRGLLADVTASAKTNRPIKTDMELLSILRKRAASAKQASNEFKAAGREDLVEREDGQAKVLEEYAGDVETMSEDDIRDAVSKTVAEVKAQAGGKANMGDVLKKLLGAGGELEGKPVERAEVARIVKEALATP
ncbi:uncharacterized protein LTR77_007911 [Saxophila tyrrhenica]|uniref:Altered inheritance of mitochondria protein 41 n=1 Tax=Saxophila tyrrhenica TaxID=1690608 RepID=A0AAV9P460_9PEZI|nr:hypothetical protein LTR77_007911 [Saxophila tyrrhenica]